MITRGWCWLFSALALMVFAWLLIVFAVESWPIWKSSTWAYLTGKEWSFRQHQFGALAMIYGSLIVALIAGALALPLSLGTAIWLQAYAPRVLRLPCKAILEWLAAIPSVVYGLLGILVLRDWIYHLGESWDMLSGDSLLTAGVLLAIMLIPTMTSLSEEALASVPKWQIAAARGLGLNVWLTWKKVVFPQAGSALWAALLLSFGRALGETIAVYMVIGRQDHQFPEAGEFWQSWIQAGQTLTTKLGGAETHLAYGDPIHWAAIMGLGLILLLMVLVVSIFSQWIAGRSNE